MRFLVCAAVALYTTAAFAQDQNAPTALNPSFDARPSSAEIIRNYPPQALHQNISGIAVLCCSANADGSLACAISSEYPAGQGFGNATMQASHSYRLSQQSQGDLAAQPGTKVRISMIWTGPVILPPTLDALRQRDADTMEACLDPVPH